MLSFLHGKKSALRQSGAFTPSLDCLENRFALSRGLQAWDAPGYTLSLPGPLRPTLFPSKTRGRRRSSCKPSLELLEERTVLATLGFIPEASGWITAPGPPASDSDGFYAHTEPLVTPFHVSYSAQAEGNVDPAPPLPGEVRSTATAEYPIKTNPGSEFFLAAQGPGVVVISGHGSVSGENNGISGGFPLFSRVSAGAGGSATYGRGLFDPIGSVGNWSTSIVLRAADEPATEVKSELQIVEIPAARRTFRLRDSTNVRVKASVTATAGGPAWATAEGAWSATFIPEVLPPSVEISATTCEDWDTSAGPVYVIIHGWNSNSEAEWVQTTTNNIKRDNPAAKVILVDWREGANTGLDVARALNNSKHAGRRVAKELIEALREEHCNIDLHQIHIIAHSYGAAVANTAAEELTRRGYGKFGQATLIDMPQHAPIPGGEKLFVSDFKAENFDYVTNVFVTDGLLGFGAAIPGDNVANFDVDAANLPTAQFIPGPIPHFETEHERAAFYMADLFADPDDSPLTQGPSQGNQRSVGDFVVTSQAAVQPGSVFYTSAGLQALVEQVIQSDAPRQNVSLSEQGDFVFIESSPAVVTTHRTMPGDADYLHFDYSVPAAGDGDRLSLLFNDTLLFDAEAIQTPQDVFLDSMLIDVSAFRGLEGELTFFLHSVGQANAQFIVKDLQFLSVQPPPNVPPELASIGNKSIDEGHVLTFTATATDPGAGQALTFIIGPGAPTGASIDPVTGAFTWTAGDGPAGFEVTVHLTDSGNPALGDFETFTITVENVAPTAILSNNGPAPEGSSAAVTFSEQFDPSAEDAALGFAYSYDFDNDGIFDLVDSPSSFATVPSNLLVDGSGTYTVRSRIKDNDGGFTDYTTAVVINNVAPAAAMTGPVAGVRGQPQQFALLATDPSSPDQAAGFTYAINWGDGSSDTASGLSGLAVEHVFKNNGVYVVEITARDKDNDVSQIAQQTIAITAYQLQDGQLTIGGTPGHDILLIHPGGGRDGIKVHLNGTVWTFADVERIVAFGQEGNDLMQVTESVRVPVELYAGAGNDIINGGGGPSIVMGESGNDLIVGGKGRNLLIGGLGSDILLGLRGDDIVIADDFLRGSLFSTVQIAARNISDRWNSTSSYANRVAALKGDLPPMISDDDATDLLLGGSGLDWFLADRTGPFKDVILDRAFAELITD
jgi:pimeloyl-ACP methyl ester carboxylesterase/Ca2+-binding RTX toxin-like protein